MTCNVTQVGSDRVETQTHLFLPTNSFSFQGECLELFYRAFSRKSDISNAPLRDAVPFLHFQRRKARLGRVK